MPRLTQPLEKKIFPQPSSCSQSHILLLFLFWPPTISCRPAEMNDLPTHSSAVEEKLFQKSHASFNSWTRPVFLPIPGVPTRRLRVLVPNISFFFPSSSSRGSIVIGSAASSPFLSAGTASRIMLVKRRRAPILIVFATLAIFLTFATLRNRGSQNWEEGDSGESPTLVYRRRDLQKIWQWEIESGHYPSHASSTFVSNF